MSSENKFKMPNSLNEHWMPFTSNKDFKETPRLITEAKGVYMKNHQGKTLIDARSKSYKQHRAKLEKARAKREERKSRLAQKVSENLFS